MKKILFLAFMLVQYNIHSQSKWDLGVEYAIDDLSLAGERNYLITDGNINGYSIHFDQKNYSLGLKSVYRFGRKLGISSGIIFNNKNFTGTYDCATCAFPEYSQQIIIQRFLNIPIAINYSFLTGKIQPAIEGGLQNNLEIENSLEMQSKGYFPEAFAAAYFSYEFSDSWIAGIGYKYQAALSSLYKTDDFKLRTISYLVNLKYIIINRN